VPQYELRRKITACFTGAFTEKGVGEMCSNRICPELESIIESKMAEDKENSFSHHDKKMKWYFVPQDSCWTIYPKIASYVDSSLSEDQLQLRMDEAVLSMRTAIRNEIESSGGTLVEVRFQKGPGTIVEN
jgi:hypothetical protein